MDWDSIRHVLALADTGSVRAAGARLGVSHSTVARRVQALEAQLGVRLFDRSRDGYALTEAGADMVVVARRIACDMAELERGLVGRDARLTGSVRLTCTDGAVAQLVLAALRPLCDANPGLELSLSTDARLYDLSKREADLAIRAHGVGQQPPGHLVGQKLVPVVLGSYVGARHRDRLDPALGGPDARWLGYSDHKMQLLLRSKTSYPDLPIWGAFSSMAAVVAAALEGLGAAQLPVYVGDHTPGLVRTAVPDLLHMGDMWLLWHPDLRENARLRAVRTCLREAMVAASDRFTGAG